MTVVVFVFASSLFFIIGLLSGQLIKKRKQTGGQTEGQAMDGKQNDDNTPKSRPSPILKNIQLEQGKRDTKLTKNMAYDGVKLF